MFIGHGQIKGMDWHIINVHNDYVFTFFEDLPIGLYVEATRTVTNA
ncbi:hypothetical protein [Alteromonas macleodii]